MRRKNVKDIAGLGTILLWQWLTVLRGPLFPSVAGVRFLGAEGGFAIFTLVLFSVFLLLALKGKSLPEVWFVRSVRAAPFLMGFAWLPWAVWGENQPLPLLFLALVLPPAGSAVHLAGWQWSLSRAPFSRQAVVFGQACLLRSAAILPLSFAALPLLSGFAILLPFLGNSLWSPPENELSPGIPLHSREAFRLSPRLALRVASFFIISAMFLSILLLRKSGEAITPQVLTDPFYTLGALAAGLVLLRWFSADLRSIYFFAQSLLAMGFIVFAALGTARPTVPLALLQLGFGTFGAYIFTLLLYLGSRTGRSEALSVVASIQAVISGSVLLGMLLTRTTGLAAGATGVPFVLLQVFWAWRCFFSRRSSFATIRRASPATACTPPQWKNVRRIRLRWSPREAKERRRRGRKASSPVFWNKGSRFRRSEWRSLWPKGSRTRKYRSA